MLGLSIQPSSEMPSPTSTVKNSTGRVITGASVLRSAAVSVSGRSTRWLGSSTTSITGGTSNCDQVWNAIRPPGARR